jgi:MoxR-like ATPase
MQLKNKKGVFLVDKEVYGTMKTAMLDEENIWNIMLLGPSGSGKTTLPILLANELGIPVLKMDCGTVRDPEEWFGKRGASGGATYFEPSSLVKTIIDGGVIILDELNRVQPYIQSTLYGILDDTRQVVIHENVVKVNPKTTFIATINEGLKYSGTFRLDEALRQRFDMFIGVDYPENEIDVYKSITDQATAEIILNILEKLRAYDATQNWGIDVSTRTGVKIAKLMNSFGITMNRAIELAIHNSVQDQKIRKSVIDVVNSHIGACI